LADGAVAGAPAAVHRFGLKGDDALGWPQSSTVKPIPSDSFWQSQLQPSSKPTATQ
jgi:hypothetical protein